ncbi:MAG: hypothetical protein NUV97_02545 [archaeon]|nr:hypothetical protein [archaeon]MCR4323958.1 hypothetical protein [Nanoarchaeota archaeon]
MVVERKKPKFLRKDWHKKIKLGSTVKKNRKWRGAKGRHNKIRLSRKGNAQRPKIGWGAEKTTRGFVGGLNVMGVSNLKEMDNVGKGQGIVIGKVGLRKRKEIIAEANKRKVKILNKYKLGESKNATN